METNNLSNREFGNVRSGAKPADVGDRLYQVAETAAALGIGMTKTWALIKAGKLEVVRLGNRTTRVKGSSIQALMAGESTVSTKADVPMKARSKENAAQLVA